MTGVSDVVHTQAVCDNIQRSVQAHSYEAKPLRLALLTCYHLEIDKCAAIWQNRVADQEGNDRNAQYDCPPAPKARHIAKPKSSKEQQER